MSNYEDAIEKAMSAYADTKKQDEEINRQQSSYRKTSSADYFTTNLDPHETTGTKIFRILPPDETGAFFYMVDYHEVPVGEYGFMKLYDPAQDGEESPLAELRAKYLESEDSDEKKKASSYSSRPFYIIKGVEKDEAGNIVDNQPKFWRFRHNRGGDGVFDKIMDIIKRFRERGKAPIFDENEGRDLILSITRQKMRNSDKTYCKVTSIMTEDSTPLSNDPELNQKLISDETTWEQVYKKYPVDYLRIVADGEVPTYSKEAGRYVPKGHEGEYTDRPRNGESVTLDEAYNSDINDSDAQTTPTTTQTQQSTPEPTKVPEPVATVQSDSDYESSVDDDDDVDLPF